MAHVTRAPGERVEGDRLGGERVNFAAVLSDVLQLDVEGLEGLPQVRERRLSAVACEIQSWLHR